MQLLDADVEEPNDHIFFNVDVSFEEPVHLMIPVVDNSVCIRCGECASTCQFGAISVFPSGTFVFESLCHGCGACSIMCPVNAISERPKEIGKIRFGTADGNISFGMGILNIGERTGVPVIRKLKKHIDEKADVVIVDAPPGTSCPVVESLRNTDFALLVTEPTAFGLHDLKLAVELTKEMGIPSGIVVNRYIPGNTIIEEFADEEGIPVLLKIPFKREIASLCAEGKLIVEAFQDMKKDFLELFEKIEVMVR